MVERFLSELPFDTSMLASTPTLTPHGPPCLALAPAAAASVCFLLLQVRQLASAAAQDGTVEAGAAKFVRHQRTTLIELQRRAAEKAQQILEKQLAVLNNSAAEDLGDQDALEAELEAELAAAEEEAEGGGDGAPSPHGKKVGSVGYECACASLNEGYSSGWQSLCWETCAVQ